MTSKRESKDKGVKLEIHVKDRQGGEWRWCWGKGAPVTCALSWGPSPSLAPDSATLRAYSLNCSLFSQHQHLLHGAAHSKGTSLQLYL